MKKICLFVLSFSLILGLNTVVFATGGEGETEDTTSNIENVEVEEVTDVVYTLEECPELKFTEKVGGVTFSNYIDHKAYSVRDNTGKLITIYQVRIGLNGCMQSEVDDTEFINFMSLPFNSSNLVYVKKFGAVTDPCVDYNFYKTGKPMIIDSVNDIYSKLSDKGIKAYVGEKTENGWGAGLTWEFDLSNSEYYKDKIDKKFKTTQFIRVNQGENVYYYTVIIENNKDFQIEVANPTDSKIYINGVLTSFDAYNINGNNYFKLRDVAYALRDTIKKFEVQWNTEYTAIVDGKTVQGAIDLYSNKRYTTVGGEMKLGDGISKDAVLTTSPILKDGKVVSNSETRTLTGYNIEGNNYFKLRDLGLLFDFNVSWDGELNSIIVNTNESYDPTT